MTKHNITILYVEDEENVRTMLSRFLQRFCKELYVAQDGQEGLELYKKHTPDIIISDIKMPKMSGLEMLSAIKKENPSQFVLLLTAHSDSEFVLEAINLNVEGYILKPIDLDIVNEKITALVERLQNRKAAKALQESEEKFRTIAHISLSGIFIYQDTFVYVNQALCDLTGYSEKELLAMHPWEILEEEDAKRIKAISAKRLQGKNVDATYANVKLRTKNKEIKTVKVSATTMPYKDGYAGTGNMIDVSDIIETKARLKLLSQAVEQTNEMIMITDIEGNIIYVNPSTLKHTQYTEEELVGNNIKLLKSGKHTKEFYKKLWQTILNGYSYKNIFINKKKDGTVYYDEKIISPLKTEHDDIRYFVSTSRDITERIALENELKHLATKDALTGVYNRYKINLKLEEEYKRAKRYKEIFSLVMFDIDHFKKVNDTFGHDAGDYVLQELCRIIMQNIRDTDSFGRWGGEEFMLLAPNTSKDEAFALADKIRTSVEEHPFEIVQKITISIGVSEFQENDTVTTILKRVDEALYISKGSGRNKVSAL